MRTQRAGWPVVAVVVAAVLAGCTSTVSGTASPASPPSAPTSEPPSQAPETTEPDSPPVDVTPAPTPGVGTLLESHRIASVTALVQVTFPDRTESCYPSGPFLTAGDLEAAYFPAGTAADVLDRWGFVAAWGQCHLSEASGLATTTLAMELSDPESAVRAAEELATEQAIDGFAPAEIPGLDAAVLLLEAGGEEVVQVFAPVGRMLAYSYHRAPPGQGLADVGRLMADQVGLLQGFAPTPQADIPSLPTDPVGLEPFTLDPPGDFTEFSGPYDLDGYLRLSIDPVRERDLLAANGFRGFYTKQSNEGDLTFAVALYAFPSSAQTNAVYTTFAELETAEFGGTAFRLPAIPDAPCFWFESEGSFYQRCYVGFGSYLASVDVLGLTAPEDVARMNELLPAQRDLIDG